MQRDLLLLDEMIAAADRASTLADGIAVGELQADRMRSESLLWNFTVLGEATAQGWLGLVRRCAVSEAWWRRMA